MSAQLRFGANTEIQSARTISAVKSIKNNYTKCKEMLSTVNSRFHQLTVTRKTVVNTQQYRH